MADIIVASVIGILLSAAAYKLWRDKKNGVKCSGCPQATHSGKAGNNCGCDMKK